KGGPPGTRSRRAGDISERIFVAWYRPARCCRARSARGRTNDAGDHIDQRGFARAGTAEECPEPPFRNKARHGPKPPEPAGDAAGEAHASHIRRPTQRASNSDTTTAPIEIAMDTSVSHIAPASPPGICVKV